MTNSVSMTSKKTRRIPVALLALVAIAVILILVFGAVLVARQNKAVPAGIVHLSPAAGIVFDDTVIRLSGVDWKRNEFCGDLPGGQPRRAV